MRNTVALFLVLGSVACGQSAPEVESDLDYHVIMIYGQYAETLVGPCYSPDAIARVLREQPIHYFAHPEGWHEGAASGWTQRQADGSFRIESTPSSFPHEFGHYLQRAIGEVTDPEHKDPLWWGSAPLGLAPYVRAMVIEGR